MNYSYATAKRLTAKQIEVYETLLQLVPAIVDVVKRFDGKMANKRIETALQSIHRGIGFHKSPYSSNWELTATEYDKRSVPCDSGIPGYYSTAYVADYTLYLADSNQENVFTENGRLDAGKMIAMIEKRAEYYRERVKTLKEQLARIDDIIARFKAIQEMKTAFSNEVDYTMRQYFGLKF